MQGNFVIMINAVPQRNIQINHASSFFFALLPEPQNKGLEKIREAKNQLSVALQNLSVLFTLKNYNDAKTLKNGIKLIFQKKNLIIDGVYVVGMRHYCQGQDLNIGDVNDLLPQPHNPVDSKAVGVYKNGACVGHISKWQGNILFIPVLVHSQKALGKIKEKSCVLDHKQEPCQKMTIGLKVDNKT